ncbi:hypothetical protein ACEZDB_18525 [Streptacidiphilus sp. N1-3]|uniref:Uncharacterized protein n=1 Tax=Streptacidiphilus alkalitolerans TaxID=3342712 RepID=A0ABV6X479_9ACTN
MTIRPEVEELISAGSLPNEDAAVETIEEVQRLIERISKPVTDEEGQALSAIFGPDGCFGLAWTLLHLIETAPGAKDARYSEYSDNEWVKRLNERVEFGRRMKEEAEG